MSTTKPRRERRTQEVNRDSNHYVALKPELYAMLSVEGKRRHDLHLDIDAIMDAKPYAELDRRAHGFPEDLSADKSGGGVGVTVNDATGEEESQLAAVEAWSQRHDEATDWLAEAGEASAHVRNAANLARYRYGYDPQRGKDEPDRPRHQNQVEMCVWCVAPAPDGRDEETGKPKVRRIDGHPVHATPCYWDASNKARAAGRSVGAVIAERVTNLPTKAKAS